MARPRASCARPERSLPPHAVGLRATLLNDQPGVLRRRDLAAVERLPFARVGPTTPTRAPGLPPAQWRLDRLSYCRLLFASERLSFSARERVPRFDVIKQIHR